MLGSTESEFRRFRFLDKIPYNIVIILYNSVNVIL